VCLGVQKLDNDTIGQTHGPLREAACGTSALEAGLCSCLLLLLTALPPSAPRLLHWPPIAPGPHFSLPHFSLPHDARAALAQLRHSNLRVCAHSRGGSD
jgi:hypothetical protein